ncbi:Zinc finger CCCH domain-containing protein 3 [Halotydeus destructor]|nr:Zinc finger CCCH domain-containing protein 3 [Halotydeus destructor]
MRFFPKPHRRVYVKKTLNPVPRPPIPVLASNNGSHPSTSMAGPQFTRPTTADRYRLRHNVKSFRVRTVKNVINRLLTNKSKSKKNFCMFYCRFGKCAKGDTCPFLHDANKVAICTRFLRGRCKDGDQCLFSHKVTPDKMPVCSFFLDGVCGKENCPYRHVNVGPGAEKCAEFTKFGHCSRYDKCQKLHVLSVLDNGKRLSVKENVKQTGEKSFGGFKPVDVNHGARVPASNTCLEGDGVINAQTGSLEFIPISNQLCDDVPNMCDVAVTGVELNARLRRTIKKYDGEAKWNDSTEPAIVDNLDFLPSFLRDKFNL